MLLVKLRVRKYVSGYYVLSHRGVPDADVHRWLYFLFYSSHHKTRNVDLFTYTKMVLSLLLLTLIS